mgnify:CR=1 FL=1
MRQRALLSHVALFLWRHSKIGRKSRKSRKVGPLLWHVPRERPKVPASFGHRTTTLALASWARGAVPEDIPQNQRVSCCRSLKPTPPPSLQRLQAVGLGSQARARARASRVRPWCRGRRPCAPAARWLARRARTGRQGAQVHQWGLLTASVLVPLLQGGSDQDSVQIFRKPRRAVLNQLRSTCLRRNLT